ncbi:MAG TPA: hypothetical protein VKU00_34455 [Chthonomonadaceae bacterium]|nr:hypothetical protein [Chthonomonadaceae bacterium]
MKSILLALCAVVVLCLQLPAHADEASQLQALVEKVAPSIVTVKVVVKQSFGGQGGDQESESKLDMPGVVVDKEGIIMVTNMYFSPARYMQMLGRGGGGGAADIKVTPTDFKVLFDQDDKEYSAFLAATDTKLDLAFLKIENLGDKKVTPVDFTGATTGSIGQEIASVNRLNKGYDYAACFEIARLSGQVTKPRKAYLLEGNISGLGLPVYDLNGNILGVMTTLEPGVKDESLQEAMGFTNFIKQMVGGNGGIFRAFVVSNQTVHGVISQAKVQAVEVAKERAAKKGTSDKPKPAPDKSKH